ncbi:MAG: nucleotidyltransferase domain-containing protein [Nitrospirae bacterium]|nr:MAG: nucleotidyltransferase domain-containing protein [Nitrospirota bacterium]
MRISEEKISFIKQEITTLLPDASIYLFGSRVDDSKRGGDIDIMILSNRKLGWKEKSLLRWKYFSKYGEQKIDLITFLFGEDCPFKQIVLEKGVKL